MDTATFLMDDCADPWGVLPRERWRAAVGIRDFMLGPGRLNPDPTATLTELSERFVEAGLPLDRCVTIVRILHAESVASVRAWDSREGTSDFVFAHDGRTRHGYATSPSALAHETGRWVRFNPQALADDTFGVLPELKQAGLVDYICAPVLMVNGMQNVFTFATRAPGGFSAADVALLRATFPALAACQEILVVHRILKEVTRMYVGEEPHERILAGDVHRGEVTHIRSAILFADMRDFTALTAAMSAEQATRLLNAYYDCVVPPVESARGEVLKFIGDGVLAIFRAGDDTMDACGRALEAARGALAAVAAREGGEVPDFDIGIALHFGEVAYGNVGSGVRLDYTVIGGDVNLASRVADLCGKLGQPLLVSADFAAQLPAVPFAGCGAHALKGLADPQEVFAPEG
jgi:adenylate cyclase